MKIQITARPGEVKERFEDLVKALAIGAGVEPPDLSAAVPEKDRDLLFPALRELVKVAGERAEAIRAVASQKIDAVLTEAWANAANPRAD
jgi:hypothetical protein